MLHTTNGRSLSTKPGYKHSALGLIPAEWEVKELGEVVVSIASGKSKTKSDSGKYPVYGSTGVIGWNDKYEYEGNKILIARVGANAGTVNIVDGKYCVSDNTLIVNPEKVLDILFSYYQLLNYKLNNLVFGSGQPLITGGGLKNISVPLPPLPEQRAVAHVLSTWDRAIERLRNLIALKAERKRALMQQLLTGKKRLKGFIGEWKEVRLGELGKTYSGLTGKDKEDFGEGKPYITYMNIFSNSTIDLSNVGYVKINENDNQNKTRYGDIFFTVSSETQNEVGMVSVLLNDVDELYLNSFCFGFRLHDFKTLLPEFARFYLRGDNIREEIFKLSQGAIRYNLSKSQLLKAIFRIPSIEEQTAIASILQSSDNEIVLLNKKLEAFKEQKKGLMQVLLTGKVRMKNF